MHTLGPHPRPAGDWWAQGSGRGPGLEMAWPPERSGVNMENRTSASCRLTGQPWPWEGSPSWLPSAEGHPLASWWLGSLLCEKVQLSGPWASIQTLAGWVTLSQLLNISEPAFPHQ